MSRKLVLTQKRNAAYKIVINGNEYIVSVDTSWKPFGYNWKRIGKATDMPDALNIIRAHSGSEIREIKDF